MAKQDDFRARLERVQKASSLPCNTFDVFMSGLIQLHHFNKASLEIATGYGPETLSDLTNKNKKTTPQLKTILAVCLAMGVPYYNIEKALALAGHTFKPGDKLHDAYRTLALHYSGTPLADCNMLLKGEGVRDCDLLGPKK